MTVNMSLPIIYQDDHLMVINKPAGIVTTPADSVKEETISDILQNEYKIGIDRGGVVHRLDKDTSGILLVAKTQAVLEALQAQFKERTVVKKYQALLHGFSPESGQIEGDVGRNPGNREKFTVLQDGKEAVTLYKLLNHFVMTEEKIGEIFEGFNKIQFRKMQKSGYGKFSLIDASPKTGRTHQIRVHFKYINHPLVSDEVYVGRKTSRLDRRWCKRQFLHAYFIQFKHPISNQLMEFSSQLPDDLKQALSCLEALK